jgi:hypothetical protein
MRKFSNGWAVWDTTTNAPAVTNGCWQTGLHIEDADDLTDLLNRREQQKQKAAAN